MALVDEKLASHDLQREYVVGKLANVRGGRLLGRHLIPPGGEAVRRPRSMTMIVGGEVDVYPGLADVLDRSVMRVKGPEGSERY